MQDELDYMTSSMFATHLDEKDHDGLEFDARDEEGDVSDVDSDTDSLDEPSPVSSPVNSPEANSNLAVSYRHQRAFVSKGNRVQVQKIDFDTTSKVADIIIKTPYKNNSATFTPSKMILHQDEHSLLLLDPSKQSSVFKMDLERGEVVEEWVSTVQQIRSTFCLFVCFFVCLFPDSDLFNFVQIHRNRNSMALILPLVMSPIRISWLSCKTSPLFTESTAQRSSVWIHDSIRTTSLWVAMKCES
jgi:hypothetical protein